jgi:hypothetical protein
MGIPRQTLRRHLQKVRCGQRIEKILCRSSVSTLELEDELVDVILDMVRKLFSLTKMYVRRVAFKYCEENRKPHNFNRTSECVSADWMSAFMRNNPQLSLRKPKPTSLARACGFSREKVNRFYSACESILYSSTTGEIIIPASRIFNADETGFTACHTPGKIIAEKEKSFSRSNKEFGKEKIITALCCVSATGTYVPPMIIFPRVRMKPALMDKAPAG